MVGQGVLRECLVDAGHVDGACWWSGAARPDCRTPNGLTSKCCTATVTIHADDLAAVRDRIRMRFTGHYRRRLLLLRAGSASLRCRLMDPERYRHLTYDITMAAGRRRSRGSTRTWCSPMSPAAARRFSQTDFTEQGSTCRCAGRGSCLNSGPLSARPRTTCSSCRPRKPVQGRLHVLVRPAGIQPLHGVRGPEDLQEVLGQRDLLSRDGAALLSYMARYRPKFMTTSEKLGRAMISVVRKRLSCRSRFWRARISTTVLESTGSMS